MEVPGRLVIVGALGCAIAGALVDRQFNSREVVKTQVVEHEVVKWHTVRSSHEVTNPDGTKTTDETTVTDGTETDKVVRTIIDQKASEQPQWLVAAAIGLNTENVKFYALSVDRKILGPISIGAFASTNKEVGARVGISF